MKFFGPVQLCFNVAALVSFWTTGSHSECLRILQYPHLGRQGSVEEVKDSTAVEEMCKI